MPTLGKTEYSVGDKFYRFKFDFSEFDFSEYVRRDVFEVVDLGYWGESVKVECVDDKRKAFMQGVFFCPGNELGKVKTKGACKYVLLDTDDVKKAADIVAGYIETKLEFAKEEYMNWKMQDGVMMGILYNLTTCGDFVKG